MNKQQKEAFDALRKKMDEAGVTESELNELIEGNNPKRNTTKKQASDAYIKGKLRDHQEYLGCEESRRMTLIQSDMYTVQKAFEDGWDEANNTMIEKVLNFIYENFYDHPHASGHICTDSFQSLEKLEEELIKTIGL